MKSKSVLIVEDNDLNRMLYENLVGQLCQYASARSGVQAVLLCQNQTFDLILMDIQLPEMNGIQAMKEIRKGNHPEVPILALTAFSQESDRQYFLDQGFDDFMVKPIRPKEFIQQIDNLLRKSPKNGIVPQQHQGAMSILDRQVLEQLLKYNSQEAMQKVLQDFLLECEETAQTIQHYEFNQELNPILEKIHTLKGNSGTLGAEKIFFSAQKAEHLARNQNLTELENELRSLKNEIHQFRDFLNQQPIFDS
jgi:two-component system, OmpR family, alkaline phosphatase synthesis response regulator PhoP